MVTSFARSRWPSAIDRSSSLSSRVGHEQMEDRGRFCFVATPVSGQSNQRRLEVVERVVGVECLAPKVRGVSWCDHCNWWGSHASYFLTQSV
jgi:hypothetical protein